MAYMRRQQARQIKPRGARVPVARLPGEEIGDMRRRAAFLRHVRGR